MPHRRLGRSNETGWEVANVNSRCRIGVLGSRARRWRAERLSLGWSRDLRDCRLRSSQGSSTVPRAGSRGQQQGACLPGKQLLVSDGWEERWGTGRQHWRGWATQGPGSSPLSRGMQVAPPSSLVEVQVTGARPSAPRGLALPINKTGNSSGVSLPPPPPMCCGPGVGEWLL